MRYATILFIRVSRSPCAGRDMGSSPKSNQLSSSTLRTCRSNSFILKGLLTKPGVRISTDSFVENFPTPLPKYRIYSYFRAYLATCSWVKHDVDRMQYQRRLIRHLRTILSDFAISRHFPLAEISAARLRRSGCARTRVMARSSPHLFGSVSVDVSDSNRRQDYKSAWILEE